jgi:hypothetical protein
VGDDLNVQAVGGEPLLEALGGGVHGLLNVIG